MTSFLEASTFEVNYAFLRNGLNIIHFLSGAHILGVNYAFLKSSLKYITHTVHCLNSPSVKTFRIFPFGSIRNV